VTCTFRHKWGKWSAPFVVSFTIFSRNGVKGDYENPVQRRECFRCGLIQEREV
jgi:hypothetical protein